MNCFSDIELSKRVEIQAIFGRISKVEKSVVACDAFSIFADYLSFLSYRMNRGSDLGVSLRRRFSLNVQHVKRSK
jgi:hypothetical protein